MEIIPQIGEIRRATEINRKGTHRWKYCTCIDCGKPRWVALVGGAPINLRCISCAAKHRSKPVGSANPNWKGGRHQNAHGYIEVSLPPDDFFHPMAKSNAYVLEHRLVVAKALGRCLHRWEIVHHKGAMYPKGSIENKHDNRYPENLQLVSDERHNQITILETKIARQHERLKWLEKRVTLLEAENTKLQDQAEEFVKEVQNTMAKQQLELWE